MQSLENLNIFRFFFLLLLSFPLYSKSQTNINKSISSKNENLVLIEGGMYKRGDKKGEVDEVPVKKIRIDSFYLGRYEVTNAEFVEFLNMKGNQFEGNTQWINIDGKWDSLNCKIYQKDSLFYVENGYEDFPVNFVSWYGARAYCLWKGGRLPTEAEWEYVAKGGKLSNTEDLKFMEDSLSEYSWYFDNSDKQLHKKGQKLQNILGIYDILGNVWEWCNDFYLANAYELKSRKNPEGPVSGDYRIIRGGSWTNQKEMLRISNRNALNPSTNRINLGFRIAYSMNQIPSYQFSSDGGTK